jgi:hypothetical protein
MNSIARRAAGFSCSLLVGAFCAGTAVDGKISGRLPTV